MVEINTTVGVPQWMVTNNTFQETEKAMFRLFPVSIPNNRITDIITLN